MREKKKTRRQLFAKILSLQKQLQEVLEQNRFLHKSIHERNLRAEKAERSEKAAMVTAEAIRKLYVDGGS